MRSFEETNSFSWSGPIILCVLALEGTPHSPRVLWQHPTDLPEPRPATGRFEANMWARPSTASLDEAIHELKKLALTSTPEEQDSFVCVVPTSEHVYHGCVVSQTSGSGQLAVAVLLLGPFGGALIHRLNALASVYFPASSITRRELLSDFTKGVHGITPSLSLINFSVQERIRMLVELLSFEGVLKLLKCVVLERRVGIVANTLSETSNNCLALTALLPGPPVFGFNCDEFGARHLHWKKTGIPLALHTRGMMVLPVAPHEYLEKYCDGTGCLVGLLPNQEMELDVKCDLRIGEISIMDPDLESAVYTTAYESKMFNRLRGQVVGTNEDQSPTWAGTSDFIVAHYHTYWETFLKLCAFGSGPLKSTEQLLLFDSGLPLPSYGTDFIKRWSTTCNYMIWCTSHALPGTRHRTTPPKTGKASFAYPNEDVYTGDFTNYLRHGHGKYVSASGYAYDGEWLNDKRHGYGVLYCEKDGFRYEGQWADDMRHGNGHLYTKVYRYWGMFEKGQFAGKGFLVDRDGSYYEGQFKDGAIHGSGKYFNIKTNTVTGCVWTNGVVGPSGYQVSRDGELYLGSFEGGKRGTSGRAFFPDGSRYEGGWLQDRMHGSGTFYVPRLTPQSRTTSSASSDRKKDEYDWLIDEKLRSLLIQEARKVGTYEESKWSFWKRSVSKSGEEEAAIECDGKWDNGSFVDGKIVLNIVDERAVYDGEAKLITETISSVPNADPAMYLVPHGYGIFKRDKILYQGRWADGKPHGEGKLFVMDKEYKGSFVNGGLDGLEDTDDALMNSAIEVCRKWNVGEFPSFTDRPSREVTSDTPLAILTRQQQDNPLEVVGSFSDDEDKCLFLEDEPIMDALNREGSYTEAQMGENDPVPFTDDNIDSIDHELCVEEGTNIQLETTGNGPPVLDFEELHQQSGIHDSDDEFYIH